MLSESFRVLTLSDNELSCQLFFRRWFDFSTITLSRWYRLEFNSNLVSLDKVHFRPTSTRVVNE